MPYLTPDEIPEETDCRSLLIPASSDWLAIVSGALTELVKTYNWEQRGSVTVDEAVAAMQTMIDTYYSGCLSCTLPGDSPVFRINADGHVEQLLPSGEWGEPEGDYELPPIEAREGGTSDDQICLAAKNAVNVLQQLYENLADSFADNLDDLEALTLLIDLIVTLLGVAVGLITFGIGIIVIAIFTLLYRGLSVITADLWDENFSDALTCLLIDCASNTDGVVTFDWDCVQQGLIDQVNDFSLLPDQLRLYAQIQYILQVIGGVDALNLAGATTAITDDDCSFCPETWCYTWDFLHASHSDDGFQTAPGFDGYGEWIDENGWVGAASPDPTPGLVLALEGIPDPTNITRVEIYGTTDGGSGLFIQTYFRHDGTTLAHDNMSFTFDGEGNWTAVIDVDYDVDELWFNPVAGTAAYQYIFNITLFGTGENPFGSDNC